MTAAPRRPYTVHLLRRRPGGTALASLVEAERAGGHQVWLVLAHDLAAPSFDLGPGDGDVVVRLADDCRRRGVAAPPGSLEYDDLVDLVAGADRVTGW